MTTMLVATLNPGKWREIRDLLAGLPAGLPYDIRSLLDMPSPPPVEETGETFLDNAVLKALAGYRESGWLTIADDSGLCVDALGGAPGVHSARYGGGQGDATLNNARLLRELADFPKPEQRRAHFVCTLVLLGPRKILGADGIAASDRPGDLPADLSMHVFAGEAHGKILHDPRGRDGFGYDPLFLSDDVPGKTFAEMELAEKNRVSHRARALRALRAFLDGSTGSL